MNIQSFIQDLVRFSTDVIYPPTREALCVRELTPKSVETLILSSIHNQVVSVLPFHHEHVRALVHEAKFHSNTHAQKLLAHAIDIFLKMKDEFDVIIPTPLSKKRLRERGHNQVEEILRFRAHTSIPVLKDIVIRVRETIPQTSLKREDRLTNLHNAFKVTSGANVKDKCLLIIDDVTTTGATLHEIRKVLLPHKPKSITLFALAH